MGCTVIKRILRRFVCYRGYHVTSVVNIANGISAGAGVPVTAWRHVCRICGDEIDEITNMGIEQLRTGARVDAVIKWVVKP